jgi:hypothetical protein
LRATNQPNHRLYKTNIGIRKYIYVILLNPDLAHVAAMWSRMPGDGGLVGPATAAVALALCNHPAVDVLP